MTDQLTMPTKILPRVHGQWADKDNVGNCLWMPQRTHVPGTANYDNNTWGEILDAFNLRGVVFNDGLPDFDPIRCGFDVSGGGVPRSLVTFSRITASRSTNFANADREAIRGTTITKGQMERHRYIWNLTWHEEYNATDMRLVFAIVHDNVSHTGGIAVVTHTGIGAAAEPLQSFTHDMLGAAAAPSPCLWYLAGPLAKAISFSTEEGQEPTGSQLAAYQRMLQQEEALAQAAGACLDQYSQELSKALSQDAVAIRRSMTIDAVHFLLMQPNGRSCLGLLGQCEALGEQGLGILLEEAERGYQVLRVGPQSVAL